MKTAVCTDRQSISSYFKHSGSTVILSACTHQARRRILPQARQPTGRQASIRAYSD